MLRLRFLALERIVGVRRSDGLCRNSSPRSEFATNRSTALTIRQRRRILGDFLNTAKTVVLACRDIAHRIHTGNLTTLLIVHILRLTDLHASRCGFLCKQRCAQPLQNGCNVAQ